MKNTAGRMLLILLALLTLLSACSAPAGKEDKPGTEGENQADAVENEKNIFPLSRGDNLPMLIDDQNDALLGPLDEPIYGPVIKEGDFTPEDMDSYCFYESTVFTGHEEKAALLIEQGKNPGLGVRGLHEQGITGKGVKVAIIDQNLVSGNPELEGVIAAYKDFGTEQDSESGSMHGIGVASILAGQTVGVAPGAQIYYAATPSGNDEDQNYDEALWWIIEENRKLPEGDKIRIISHSAGPRSEHEKYEEAVKAAEAEGILVINCCDSSNGLALPGFFDLNDPDDPQGVTIGFPDSIGMGDMAYIPLDKVCAPCSHRTVPYEYYRGNRGWRYDGRGGLSWSVPYVAGVLALGFEIDPGMTAQEAKDLLIETAYHHKTGDGPYDGYYNVIDPPAFVEAVKARLK